MQPIQKNGFLIIETSTVYFITKQIDKNGSLSWKTNLVLPRLAEVGEEVLPFSN